jgi:hypothetical protein
MEDFDYLAADSNAAWLDGRGDGRFERYERFYHQERAQQAEKFDLEMTNDGYGEWASRQPALMLSFVSGPWFGQVAVAFFSVVYGISPRTRTCRQVAGCDRCDACHCLCWSARFSLATAQTEIARMHSNQNSRQDPSQDGVFLGR